MQEIALIAFLLSLLVTALPLAWSVSRLRTTIHLRHEKEHVLSQAIQFLAVSRQRRS
jgi:hypothetical protein